MKWLTRLVATLTLLAGSTSALAATDPLRLVPPAPKLARALTPAKTLADGSTLFAPDASRALHVYIVEWEHYPEQAQAALDQLDNVLTTECAEARRVDAAQAAMSSDQRSASAEAHKMTFAKVGVIAVVVAAITFGVTEYFEHKGDKR